MVSFQGNCTAKELDKETGLYYYGARYLDPKYSRWISTDPALGEYMRGSSAGEGGAYNTVNLNLYHYAGNNPIKYTDPDGNNIAVGTVAGITFLTLAAYYTLLNYYQNLEVQEANRRLAESASLGFETAKEEIKNAFVNAGNCIRENVELYNAAKAKARELAKDYTDKKSTGSYTITFESGKTYSGKGSIKRSIESAAYRSWANNAMPTAIDWTPAETQADALETEYMRIQDHGGPKSRYRDAEKYNYNKIQSHGEIIYMERHGGNVYERKIPVAETE